MPHSVQLSWNADTDPVDGYNIYRGPAKGGETTLVNTSLVTGTTFTDPSPVVGTDFYTVKAVKNGVESAASNEVSAVILPAAPTNLTVVSAA